MNNCDLGFEARAGGAQLDTCGNKCKAPRLLGFGGSSLRIRTLLTLVNRQNREINAGRSGNKMNRRLTLIYWKRDKFWLGKLLEYPEIMTQGETLEELEDNIKDACLLMAMEDVPDGYQSKEFAI